MGCAREIPDRDRPGAVRSRDLPQAGIAARARLSEGRPGLAHRRIQRGDVDQERAASECGPALRQLVPHQRGADHLRDANDGNLAAHRHHRHQRAGLCASAAGGRGSGRRLFLPALLQDPPACRRGVAESAPTLRHVRVVCPPAPVLTLTDRITAQRLDEPVLRVRGLTKVYGAARVVGGVCFDLHAGEVLTILGPSGCGKSTTLRLIAGLEQPDGGEIWVRGRLVASSTSRVMVAPEGRKVGLVFQSYAIWPHMTVAENIGYPLKVRRIERDTLAVKVAEMIRLMRLDGLDGRMPTELSGGQQQRVALARAVVYEPDLLLLHQPFTNP